MGLGRVKVCRFAGAKVGKKAQKRVACHKNSPYDLDKIS
jgi:hypothetical protein